MTTTNLATTYAGDTYQVDFLLKTSTGAPQDLSGATVRFGLARPGCLSSPVYTAVSGGSDLTITDETGGAITLTVPKGTLKRSGRHVYELEVTFATGESFTYAQGSLLVKDALYPST
jgi:hypothetical protein